MPRDSRVAVIASPPAHLTRVSALSGQAIRPCPAGCSGRPARRRWEYTARVPVAFRPPAFASRVIPDPVGNSVFLTVDPPGVNRRDPTGIATFRMHKTRPDWVPSRPRDGGAQPDRMALPGRRLPLRSGQSCTLLEQPPCRAPDNEASNEGSLAFTRPVFPRRWSPDGTGTLGLLPWASHPAVTHDARQGGDRSTSTDLSYVVDIADLLKTHPLATCDLVSHGPLRVDTATRGPS